MATKLISKQAQLPVATPEEQPPTTPDAQKLDDAAATLLEMLGERDAFLSVIRETDFSKRTWIECIDCPGTSGSADVMVKAYDPGHIVVDIKAEDDTWLIVSESTFPGWKATINGVETPIYTANYLFQAIRVPKGEHRVTFTYEDIAVQAVNSFFNW